MFTVKLEKEDNKTEIKSDKIKEILRLNIQKNSALNRVHLKLNSTFPNETTITSYDRMHHRHNRS